MNDLRIPGFVIGAIPLYIDNEAALSLTRNPKFHSRTKHIDVKFHFIRDANSTGQVNTKRVDTKNNVADVLTKGMAGQRHMEMMQQLGMVRAC